MLPPNTILQGRYRIIQQLGTGGMGAVYQAMDENVSCLVAVKETFAEKEEHRRAFRREAQLLANLTHPALPHVMDHFTHDDGQFLVMQFVPGNDLAELLALRERPFATDKVLAWADQLLDALEELHSYDPPIIHRDIKPSNLKLTPKGKVILLDFGLAKGAAGQMSTLKGVKAGASVYGFTPHYAPLEQIRGIGTDPRSDLYSLGAALWTLLTCEVPPDALARVDEKEEGKPDPLHPANEKNPEVPQAVAAVLHQAMALNRNQRPHSAAEMRQLLKDAVRQAEFEAAEISRQRAEEETRRAEEERQRREEEERLRQEAQAQRRKEEGERQRALAEAEQRTAEKASRRGAEKAESPPAATNWLNRAALWLVSNILKLIAVALLIAVAVSLAVRVVKDYVIPGIITKTPAGPSTETKAAGAPPAGTVVRNSLGMEFVYVPAGSFMMGSEEGSTDEKPVHQVTIPNGFYMGRYEVTQAQWQAA
ncbi:MAG TPA: protein kinase, partial [Pyrinomonadaceae bacterium]|nr:protein kinase [Pyrinomonadaceae bacterium]